MNIWLFLLMAYVPLLVLDFLATRAWKRAHPRRWAA